MNLLFLNYGQADNNSAYHILGHARRLAARGHDVCVAVAKSVPDGKFESREGFRLASHHTVLKMGPGFANGAGPDILHAWTPRENVRLFAERFHQTWGRCTTLIHLEDNEEAIFERFTGLTLAQADAEIREWPKGLIHPQRFRSFLGSADGVTMVHRCLGPLVPESMRTLEIVPIMDFSFFANGVGCARLRSRLEIPPDARVIMFNGNDHAANVRDMRALYDAVELLIKRGMNVVFVRTGEIQESNYEGLRFRSSNRCIELGYIERSAVPEMMRLADIVIQPGDADEFNSYRLPAKVPEYLSMGIPLLMSSANIGLELAEASAARVLPSMTPSAIAEAVEVLLSDKQHSEALSRRGREFAFERFHGNTVTPALEAFYEDCIQANRHKLITSPADAPAQESRAADSVPLEKDNPPSQTMLGEEPAEFTLPQSSHFSHANAANLRT